MCRGGRGVVGHSWMVIRNLRMLSVLVLKKREEEGRR